MDVYYIYYISMNNNKKMLINRLHKLINKNNNMYKTNNNKLTLLKPYI